MIADSLKTYDIIFLGDIMKDLEYTKKQYNLDANIKRYSDAIEEVGLWNS